MASNNLLKVSQFAKDLNLKSKDIVEVFEGKKLTLKSQTMLAQDEFEILLETLTRNNQIDNIGNYIDGVTYIPSRKKVEEPKTEKAATAPAAEKPAEKAADVKAPEVKPEVKTEEVKAPAPKAPEVKAPAKKEEAPAKPAAKVAVPADKKPVAEPAKPAAKPEVKANTEQRARPEDKRPAQNELKSSDLSEWRTGE